MNSTPEGYPRHAGATGTRNRSRTSLGEHRTQKRARRDATEQALLKWVLPKSNLRFRKARPLRFHHLPLKGSAAEVHRAACEPQGALALIVLRQCLPRRKYVDCCHLMVMVTRAKAIESPAPSFGPRTTMITPFAFRNRATPIPPAIAPPAPTAI